jgi:hypothetical protein
MPNIEYLFIDCIESNIDEKFYKEFVKKVLSLNLKSLYFSIMPDILQRCPYSDYDLMEIKPNIDISRYENIYVYNFDSRENIRLNLY